MHNLNKLAFSVICYTLAGYLIGMGIGFTLFDPNLDVYALLGAVLAIFGAVIGLIPFFRRRATGVFGALVGFYLGALLSILFFGNAAHDDLIEILQRGGLGVLLVMITSVLGGVLGARLPLELISVPAIGALVGGFVGGYLFGFVFRWAVSTKMVGISPFVIGCAALAGGGIGFIQRARSKTT